jgi:2,3-diketo-5-methylthio-1-phosphopentane phosphatase
MVKVFVDFDGTITKTDVGNAFFREFAGREQYDALLEEYKAERISAQECFRRGVAAIGSLTREEAATFVRGQGIDPSFGEFVRFCAENGVEPRIVSDGLDFYIHEILSTNGIQDVPVFSNVLEFVTDGNSAGARISFPRADAECTRCACCKRNIMLTRAGDEDIIVYVGEGYSDRCPAQYADVVFAKDALQTFCQEQNISYYLYSSFRDVINRMEILLAKKRLRKRLAAEMKRKELFTQEP